jgi:type IV fimbrial biogenesis protein FimT
MMRRATVRGFSLIELMVTVTVMGVMLTLAIPGIGNWIQNSRVRTVSEEIQNGLRMAQSEAVNRNRQVAFVRTAAAPARNAAPSATGTNWYIQVLPLPSEVGDATFDANSFIQGGAFSTQSGATVNGGGVAAICFNSVGRVVNNNATLLGADCVAPASATDPYDINVTRASSDRAMRVELFLGGRVRLCDVNASSTQPNACTP